MSEREVFESMVAAYPDRKHLLAGRVAGTWHKDDMPMVSFCTCGLAFWGSSTAVADERWHAHRREAGE